MGKLNSIASSWKRQYVSDIKDMFTSDGKILFCQSCGKCIVAQQRSQVTRHLSESTHVATVVC
jgi:hypothetical protein